MRYQFFINGEPAGVARRDYIEALQDAVNAGYATWISEDQIQFDNSKGGGIEQLPDL